MKINYDGGTIKSQNFWNPKCYGVIFVEKEGYIDIVHKYLVDQDDCWSDEKLLIQVKPKKIGDIINYTYHCGKTNIYDIEQFVADMEAQNIDLFIYQE